MAEVFFISERDNGQRARNLELLLRPLGAIGGRIDGSDQDGAPGRSIHDFIEQACDSLPGSNFWLIDDRVASDWISLSALIDETAAEETDVALSLLDDESAEPSPFAGILRMSEGVARRIRNDDRAMKLLKDQGPVAMIRSFGEAWTLLEWDKNSRFDRFRGGTDESPRMGVQYPIEDLVLHSGICRRYQELQDRLGGRIADLSGSRRSGWYVEDVGRWQHWFARAEKTKVLELGASDGICSNAMLDLLFPHPESEVHSILTTDGPDAGDTEEASAAFDYNAKLRGRAERLFIYEGNPVEILAWMISDEGYWESFDFIFAKPPELVFEALSAAFQAWYLLKPEGILVFDCAVMRIGFEHVAKDALLQFKGWVGGRADVLMSSDRIILRKRPPTAATRSKDHEATSPAEPLILR